MDVSKLNQKQASSVAVAYLANHIEEAPDECKKLIKKLNEYEKSAQKINMAMKQAEASINALQNQGANLFGSISTIVELIADDLPEDKVFEWCEKYELPEGVELPKELPSQAPLNEPDIAGGTSKVIPPIEVNKK